MRWRHSSWRAIVWLIGVFACAKLTINWRLLLATELRLNLGKVISGDRPFFSVLALDDDDDDDDTGGGGGGGWDEDCEDGADVESEN